MVVAGGPARPQEVTETKKDNDSGIKMSDLSDVELGFQKLRYGSIVSGTIVRADPREILIDIGAKSEGIVEPKELEKMSAEAIKKLHVGDSVLAFVLNAENRDGHVVLSLARAQLEHDWRELEEVFKSGRIIETQVAGFNKGGLIIRIGKVRGFVPATQLEGTYRKKTDTPSAEVNGIDLTAYVGKKVKLKVIELDRERNRLILSERAAMRELRKEQKERLLQELQEGAIVTGTVTSVQDFGVFVDLGGVDGMIHMSELAWGKIEHPRDVVQVGDKIQVQVLSVDRERERVALSLKRTQPEPWSTVEERYKVGQLVTGTITKLATFGAFARLEDNIEGLIHISELADRRIQHPKEVVKEGDTLQLRVIRIDAARRRLGLSLKRATEEYSGDALDLDTPDNEWPDTEIEPEEQAQTT